MKNIHLFETQDAYDAAKKGLILPTVSYIKDTKVVEYNPSVDANEHKFVEIAGIKWATMNVGATSITDYGYYFQWGDTQGYTEQDIKDGKKKFNWSNCKFTTDGGKSFTKYNGTDGKTVLELVDDAVNKAWGGSWRMPTKEEFLKLRHEVTTGWTDSYNESGVAGMILTDKNDKTKTLFLPACGFAGGGSVDSVGSYGYYWLSSLNTDSVRNACGLLCSSGVAGVSSYDRYIGRCVRGVWDDNLTNKS